MGATPTELLMPLLSTGMQTGIAKTQRNSHHLRTHNRQGNVKVSTKKGVFSESPSLSFACPSFPHHGEETQALQPLPSNTVLRDTGEKKGETPEEGIFKPVKNQAETVAKRTIHLQKCKPRRSRLVEVSVTENWRRGLQSKG